jgi:hypothetical protein
MFSAPEGRDWVSPLSSGKWRRKEILIILQILSKLIFFAPKYRKPTDGCQETGQKVKTTGYDTLCLTCKLDPIIKQMPQIN